jgi:hypothetical protein
VIFVVGAQKLVPTLAAAHQRIYQHSLPLEDARAQAAYEQHSQVGKILEIHQELPGRIHVVLIRQPVATEPPSQPDPPRHQEMARCLWTQPRTTASCPRRRWTSTSTTFAAGPPAA